MSQMSTPPLSKYEAQEFLGVDTVPLYALTGRRTMNAAGGLQGFSVRPPRSLNISNFYVGIGNNAIGSTLARIGLYTMDTLGNLLSLVARSVDFHTFAAYTGGFATLVAPLDTTGGFTNPYTIIANTLYSLVFLHVGSVSPPDLASIGSGLIPPNPAPVPTQSVQSNTAVFTDLPASLAVGVSGLAVAQTGGIWLGIL